MSAGVTPDPWLIGELGRLAAGWTGFAPESIRARAIERAIADLGSAGWTRERIVAGALASDPEVVRAVRENVVVGETWFFRHPSQFEHLAREIVPAWLASGAREIRAWSAGCATGAEAYSLAAVLLGATAGHEVRVEVLGTDLLDRNVEAAIAGRYGRGVLRASGPPLQPIGLSTDGDSFEVLPQLRAVTRFRQHSLLDPLPAELGAFQIVMCRHVMLYFAPDSAERVCRHLAAVIERDGVLVMGTIDRLEPPPGLTPCGPPELQMFRRPRYSERPPAPARPAPFRAARREPAEPVALHLACLRSIEAGDDAAAARMLDELCSSAPEYLPARVERALVSARAGDRRRATELMRAVARDTVHRDPAEVLPGPEPLPLRFYRDAALSFLGAPPEIE